MRKKMSYTTEGLEYEAVALLLEHREPLRREAPENLLRAITLGHLTLESAEQERKHIDQSIKAGRLMTFMEAVA
jgi:hypothetical protein